PVATGVPCRVSAEIPATGGDRMSRGDEGRTAVLGRAAEEGGAGAGQPGGGGIAGERGSRALGELERAAPHPPPPRTAGRGTPSLGGTPKWDCYRSARCQPPGCQYWRPP